MNKLNVACYCVNFERYDELLEIMAPLDHLGIGVELSLFDDADYIRRLRAARARFAQYYTTFHAPHLEVEATSAAGSPGHARIIRAMDESFDVYREFGAHSIVMHTNQRSFAPEEQAELQAQSIRTINEIGQMAAAKDALLLIENVGEYNVNNLLFDEDAFIAMFDELRPEIGCLIDIGHAMINGWDFEKVIRALAPKIKAYHLHNNDGVSDIHRPLYEPGMKYSPEALHELLGWAEKYTPEADWVLEYAPGAHITPALVEGEVKRLLDTF